MYQYLVYLYVRIYIYCVYIDGFSFLETWVDKDVDLCRCICTRIWKDVYIYIYVYHKYIYI